MLSIVLTAFEIYFEAMTMTFIENSAVKVLTSKTIRKDLQLLFLPLNVVQSIFFCPKYMINNDVISPNTQKSLLIPIIAVVVFMALYFYRNYIILFYDCYSKLFGKCPDLLGYFWSILLFSWVSHKYCVRCDSNEEKYCFGANYSKTSYHIRRKFKSIRSEQLD